MSICRVSFLEKFSFAAVMMASHPAVVLMSARMVAALMP